MSHGTDGRRRRSIRLQGYDYTRAGAYYLTVCAHATAPSFGTVDGDRVRLTVVGEAAAACWLAIPDHFPGVDLDAFVVMPDHLHAVVVIGGTAGDGRGTACRARTAGGGGGREAFGRPVAGSVPTIVRSAKGAATKAVNELLGTPGRPLWHRNYFEHVIRNERSLERIRAYIMENPARWNANAGLDDGRARHAVPLREASPIPAPAPPSPAPAPSPVGARHAVPRAPLSLIGNAALLDLPLLAFFCSRRCPGSLILRAYDLARELRAAGVPVVSGFQTPIEQECLALLLRGEQPVVVCPARGIAGMRVPPVWRAPLEAGRLLVVSPFAADERRPTVALAERRNRFVADLAARVLVAHADPGGATERLSRALIGQGKPVLTVLDPANRHLLDAGALPVNGWTADAPPH